MNIGNTEKLFEVNCMASNNAVLKDKTRQLNQRMKKQQHKFQKISKLFNNSGAD
jgi:cell division protein ZapA (FtsZ GTPase activity inhibitor)